MSSNQVRRIDQGTLRHLRQQAQRNGVSMGEEVCRMLNRTVSASERLGDLARETFGPDHGVDMVLPRHDPAEPLTCQR